MWNENTAVDLVISPQGQKGGFFYTPFFFGHERSEGPKHDGRRDEKKEMVNDILIKKSNQ